MIPTPYLKKFATNGGTLYVFPSVSKDLTRTLISNDYEFKFSHFACLNIPDIKQGIYDDSKDKGFYISTLMGSDAPSSWTSDAMGDAISENIQNYVMNFETAILNGIGDNDDYDSDILTTVSEKVFWNWMQKVGAIKFTEEGTLEDAPSISKRTVQYIGNLDVMNTVEIGGDSFNELYIHIPSTVGASTNVYFRTGAQTDNKNYLNKNYSVGTNENYLIGRNDDGGISDFGLKTRPYYDIDNGVNVYKGDMGHTIDFRDSSYADGYGINTMNGESYNDFEFNAILIYYDFLQKTSDNSVKSISTNLYGILFLEEVTDDSQGVATENNSQGHFQRYPKKRETVYGNGNSYALRVDFKIDTLGDGNDAYTHDVAISTPNDVVAMGLYEKALIQLQKCVDFFYTQKTEIVKLTERVEALENLVIGIDTISSIRDQVNRLYSLYESNAVVDTSSLLSLIDSNTRKLENIMNGGKDVKLQFDTDVLQAGEGIGMIKTPNKVIINSEQRYSMNEVITGTEPKVEINSNNKLSTTNLVPCEIKLKPGENFAVIYFDDQGVCKTNLNIDIDDSDCNWQAGQSLKIYFYGEYGSISFDDRPDIGVVITPKSGVSDLIIEGSEFEGNNLIEIICVETGSVDGDKFIYLINK